MNLKPLFITLSALVPLVVAAAQGCSPPGASTLTAEDRICIPGDYVFCRCADKAPGTKLCRQDAKSFDPCTTDESGECSGGEIDDPNTGNPIPTEAGPDADVETDAGLGVLDSCPGKSTAVVGNVELTLQGDTTTAKNDRKGKAGACAAGVGGNDHVYHLIPTGSGSLEVKVQGSEGLDPVVYLRSTCEDEDSQVSCGPVTSSKLAQFKVNVVSTKEYFLFIDGASSSAGKYVATLKLTTTSFCGDGTVDENEACDDGNKVEDDGCSNNCKQVNGNPVSGGSCPGHPVDVWSGQTVTGTGTTNSYGNAWNAPSSSTCGTTMSGTNDYQDHVYAVTPHANGTLVVSVTAPAVGTLANHMISARRTCANPETDKTLCTNAGGAGVGETLSIAATKDQTVFVTVDGGGSTNNKGDYKVSFKLDP